MKRVFIQFVRKAPATIWLFTISTFTALIYRLTFEPRMFIEFFIIVVITIILLFY